MSSCLRYAPLVGSREGELPAEEARALRTHLAACPTCRDRARDVAATEGLLSEALHASAAARDFTGFVDQVTAAVVRRAGERSTGSRPASSRREPVRNAAPSWWT